MGNLIGQRELRNDNAEIMRRVEAGESFTVTRNGKPVADLVPHQVNRRSVQTLARVQADFRALPQIDLDKWNSDRAADDEVFGPDDIGEPS
jgi:prevent-host-death family protein